MSLDVNGVIYETDEEGYLANLSDWAVDVANALAVKDGGELEEAHWEVIYFLREYYEEYQIAPKPLASDLVATKGIANIYINYSLTAQPNKPVNMQGYQSQPAAYKAQYLESMPYHHLSGAVE
jgi:TusE/DsrC/DsvC family sulfur relay protein